MTIKTITAKEYLTKRGIWFKEVSSNQLKTRCVFNGCDDDSKGDEAHLYIEDKSGLHDCKKCGAKGNLITLAKHLGDDIKDIVINRASYRKKQKNNGRKTITNELVEACHKALPLDIRKYLNDRGIPDTLIDKYKLGYSEFYWKCWIVIPVKDENGNYILLKLRRPPSEDNTDTPKMLVYPKGAKHELFDHETLNSNSKLVLCEGEFDKLVLEARGISAITFTGGAEAFKEEWKEPFEELVKAKKLTKITVCYDNDDPGKKGAEKAIKTLLEIEDLAVCKIDLPEMEAEHKDVTDYLVHESKSVTKLLSLTKDVTEKIDTSKFKPMASEELTETLGHTIKKDNNNKLITFMCMLTAYTEDCQQNISFNAPSATGKSFIPIEIARLFPAEDVMEIGYASPNAFFHEQGIYNKEKNEKLIDLSSKIVIFLDQPHNQLLERLRPVLSHDKKEIRSKITDKDHKGGNRTKTAVIKGYPVVIFCTAGLKIDEQESTRFILLSPEITQEKLRQAIHEKFKKESDKVAYLKYIEDIPARKLLKERIRAIKQGKVKDIILDNPVQAEEMFLKLCNKLKPRHQRDVGRLISLIKAFALLNCWFREKDGNSIITNGEDLTEAFKVWELIAESQELNLPPYIYQLFKEVILPAYEDKQKLILETYGLSRKEVLKKHYEVHGRPLQDWTLRQEIIPMLENAGLIYQEEDKDDKRKKLIYPTVPLTISQDKKYSE